MDMDMTERKRKERQLIIVAVIAAAIFAAGWIFLPILAEKILLGVILVLIVGAMYLDNSTGRYICKRILLALMTVFIIAAITFFTMNAIPGGPFSKEKAPDPAVQAMLEACGCSPEEAAYFGDDQDDIEPIRRCGMGIAVSNGIDEAKAVADYIAGSNDEDGVARFIESRLL